MIPSSLVDGCKVLVARIRKTEGPARSTLVHKYTERCTVVTHRENTEVAVQRRIWRSLHDRWISLVGPVRLCSRKTTLGSTAYSEQRTRAEPVDSGRDFYCSSLSLL